MRGIEKPSVATANPLAVKTEHVIPTNPGFRSIEIKSWPIPGMYLSFNPGPQKSLSFYVTSPVLSYALSYRLDSAGRISGRVIALKSASILKPCYRACELLTRLDANTREDFV